MHRSTLCAAVLAGALGTVAATAQGPTLLKNFNNTLTGNFFSGSSTAWAQIGSKAFITFTTNEQGNELWTYDALTGTLAAMTEGLFPGDSDYVGNARSQIAFNGEVYFTAWTVDLGRELYKTDGTVAGTSLVKDILPGNPEGGPFTTGPVGFTTFGGQLFFTAEDGVNGRQLWKTDGTTAGTVVVDPSAPGVGTNIDYAPTPAALFYSSNGNLFYLTLSPDTITDVDSVNYENVGDLGVLGTELYFSARSTDPLDTIGTELYKSDGLSITLAEDILPTSGESSFPGKFATYNGRLYFAAARAQDPTSSFRRDTELFEYYQDFSDPLNPVWVLTELNINQTTNSSGFSNSSFPAQFTENNGLLFFSANDGINGTELWTISAGGISTAAMIELDPQNPGGIRPGSGSALSSSNAYLRVMNSVKVVFVANDGSTGTEIWESDGTPAGTVIGADHRPGTSGTSSIKIFPSMGGSLMLFRGNNNNGWSTELHSYRGNLTSGSAGVMTAEVDVNPQGGRDGSGGFSNAEGMVDAGYGVGLFAAQAYDNLGNSLGQELWRSDGTPAGTVFVKDIRTGSNSSSLREFAQAGTLVYFQATDGTVGSELYFANGVPEGQPGHSFGLAADIKVGGSFDSSRPQYLTYAGNSRVVFKAQDGVLPNNQSQLFWAAGGSFGAISHFVDNGGGPVATPVYAPEKLVYHNGLVYMGGGNDDTNTKTWDIYSTNASTAQKRTDMAFQQSPGIIHFDDANGLVYFSAYYRDILGANAPPDTNFGWQLWVVDSAFSTTPVRLTNEAVTSSFGDPIGAAPSNFADLNGSLFFYGESLASGAELWSTDGTAAGTSVFLDINPGPAGSGFSTPYVIDAGMVFAADDGLNGQEMWLSDGTVGGTTLIADTTPGIYPQGDGAPSFVTPVGSRRVAYRYGRYTDKGSEVWTCDGTAPQRVTDINVDNGDSEIFALQLQNGLLTFEATQWQIGTESYTLDFGANSKAFGVTSAPANDSQHASITSNDPVLGAPFTISGVGALPSSTCGLAVSFPSGEVVFQGLSLYVDLGTFQIVAFATADAQGNFTFPAQQFPANLGYVGADLVYQAASLNPLGLFKSRVTNALYMNVDLL